MQQLSEGDHSFVDEWRNNNYYKMAIATDVLGVGGDNSDDKESVAAETQDVAAETGDSGRDATADIELDDGQDGIVAVPMPLLKAGDRIKWYGRTGTVATRESDQSIAANKVPTRAPP